jgi:hypothetical protein
MAKRESDASKSPKVLTDADFVRSGGYLVPRSLSASTCLLIVVHADLYGNLPTEDESDSFEACDFIKMVLAVAEEFQEVQAGLLNHRDASATLERLPTPSASAYAEALICLNDCEWRQILCGEGETSDTIRLWLRGILLSNGFRPTNSTDDLNVRLAYELGQPPRYSFSAARWDVPGFRLKLYSEAKQTVAKLTDMWSDQTP